MYSYSVRLDSIYKDIFPDKQEGVATAVDISFGKLLKCVQPAWKKLEDPAWAAYEEEADWRVVEFRRYALPVFDRLKTVGGVDWWYNESNLPWEISKVAEKRTDYFDIEKATIYAYLSGNPKAEATADNFEKFVSDEKSLSAYDDMLAAERYPAVLDYCRSGRVKPVGRDEPA